MRLRIGIWSFALQDVYSFPSLAFVKRLTSWHPIHPTDMLVITHISVRQ